MDSEKLLRVLVDLQEQESQFELSSKLSNLITYVSQNDAASLEQAQAVLKELNTSFTASKLSTYPPSLTEILEFLSALDYRGDRAIELLRFSLNTPLESVVRLNKYLDGYRRLLEIAGRLVTSLTDAGFDAYNPKEFQIGFLLPSDLSNLQLITKRLALWDRYIVLASEITAQEEKVATLSRVSNGSAEFFVSATLSVAKLTEEVLKRILKLYGEVQAVQKAHQEIVALKLSNQKEKLILDELVQAQQEKEEEFIEITTSEIFSEYYKGEIDEQAELKGKFGVAVKVLLKNIQEGIRIEITPPIVPKGTADGAKTSQGTLEKAAKSMSLQNRELIKLYAKTPDQKQLPFKLNINEAELLKQSGKKRVIKKSPKHPESPTS